MTALPSHACVHKSKVHKSPVKPRKSLNFIRAFSRTGKSGKKATGKLLNSTKKYEVYGSQ